MDKDAVLSIVSRFRDALEAQGTRVDKLVLFGSYAQSTYREGSDIDLAVISRDFADKDYWQRIEILSEAIYEVFEPIEAVAFTPEEWESGDSPVVQYAKNGEVV